MVLDTGTDIIMCNLAAIHRLWAIPGQCGLTSAHDNNCGAVHGEADRGLGQHALQCVIACLASPVLSKSWPFCPQLPQDHVPIIFLSAHVSVRRSSGGWPVDRS